MNWLGQHWYTYVFLILAFSCSVNAAVYSDKLKTSKVIWFLFMACIWLVCVYFNWIF